MITIKKKIVILVYLFSSTFRVFSQDISKDSSFSAQRIVYDLENERDISDVIGSIKKAVLKPKLKNQGNLEDTLQRKKHKLHFAYFPAIGYALQTGVTGLISSNVSFYTGELANTNISSISITPQLSFNYPLFMLPLNFNIWSPKNKYDFTGDIRYYKYPTNTYGLGGHTNLSDADLIDYNYLRLYMEVLRKISSTKLYAGGGYNLDYHYGIVEKGSGADFKLYNGKSTITTSSGLNLAVVYDSRSNQNYPEKSMYANFRYRCNSSLLGSDSDWQSLFLEYRKYINMPFNSHNVLAFWGLAWHSFGGKVPYLDLPSTGWDNYSNTGRGYIQGRLRGPAFLYIETEYRFRILKNGLLGGNVFVNGQSVSEQHNTNFETILPGVGFGLRVKLNKTSRVNYSVDYGWGIGGSRGLFFNIGEVF